MLNAGRGESKLVWRATRKLPASRVLSFVVLALFAQSAFSEDSLKKDLVRQQEKLSRQTRSVGKVKTLIKISAIHLRAASQEVKKSDLSGADRNLEHYSDTVEQALEILKSSDRDAQKNPAGFKEFEISLRKQLRVLDDLRSHYSFDQAKGIDAAIAVAKGAQDAMFAELFGPENTGKRREKNPPRKPNQRKE